MLRTSMADDSFRLARRLTAIHVWGPLAMILLLSLLVGVDLENHWGTPYLWVLPLWMLYGGTGEWLAAMGLKRILTGVIGMHIMMAAAYLADL
jgi:hypothetical protein